VDHEKLAEVQIRAMTVADLNRFVVMCSLMPRPVLPRLQFSRNPVEGSEPHSERLSATR